MLKRSGLVLAGWLGMLALVIGATSMLSGCATQESNEELAARLDQRNESYRLYRERRAMRMQARDERYRMWFDSIMQ